MFYFQFIIRIIQIIKQNILLLELYQNTNKKEIISF